MAYDKVVDSAVLDAGLKTIADAIRAKAGTSGNMAFPTAMAEAIAAIQTGGGGGLTQVTATVSFPTAVTEPTFLTDVIDGTVVFAVLRNTIKIYNLTAKETASAVMLSVYALNADGTELENCAIKRTSSTSGTARPLETASSTCLYVLTNRLRYYAGSAEKLFGDYELTYFVMP